MLRKIFGPKKGEVIGGRRKLHNEELHKLHFVTSIIKYNGQVKKDEMGMACSTNGRTEMHIEFLWETQKQRATRKKGVFRCIILN
jgi:hypothetical protein